MAQKVVGRLDPWIVAATDDEFYTRHPELVINGRRVPLSAHDQDQACLRQEWISLYGENGGEIEPVSPTSQRAGAPVQTCLGALEVIAVYDPYTAPAANALVSAKGPSTVSGTTDQNGTIVFENLPPGDYEVRVSYQGTHPLVEAARNEVGATNWATNANRPPYPVGANKCNLFVYETANSAGYTVPQRTRFSLSRLQDVWYPPLAGDDWADTSANMGSWKVVTDPLPGDVVAQAINYSDASGHVGIVSYPRDGNAGVALVAGSSQSVTVELKRQTVSAAGHQIVENDWGFRSGQTVTFRRY